MIESAVRLEQTKTGFTGSFQAMGSPCEVLLELDDEPEAVRLAQIVADEAQRIEAKFSRYLPGNIIDQINSAEGVPVPVDDETARLLDFAQLLTELSGGLFDITSGVLRRAWTFDGGDHVPDQADIEKILPVVGWHRTSWRSTEIQMPAGMQIDLGGIGKEYAVDQAAELLRQACDARCLVNFGGDLAVANPGTNGRAWKVGVESLVEGRLADRLIDLRSGALATSGDARRFVMKDGVRYGHILDPRSGWPVAGAPRSITVAADTCTQAGMLATLAMLRGEDAEVFLDAQSVKYWCLR